MRLFIGMKTGCEEYLLLLQQELKKLGKGSFTRKDNLHMTLKFLGGVPYGMVEELCDAISETQKDTLKLTCEGLQVFGRDIISVKVGGERDKLSALHDRLELALEKRGFAKEKRRFCPHITLARQFFSPQGYDIASVTTRRVEFQVDKVVLFESTREAGELVYKPVFISKLI